MHDDVGEPVLDEPVEDLRERRQVDAAAHPSGQLPEPEQGDGQNGRHPAGDRSGGDGDGHQRFSSLRFQNSNLRSSVCTPSAIRYPSTPTTSTPAYISGTRIADCMNEMK